MPALNECYPAIVVALWILPRDIICDRYNVVDIDSEIASPIRRSTQEPVGKSDIRHPGTGYLNEPKLPSPKPTMGRQVMKNYKPAYQGVQNYTNQAIITSF